MRTEDGHIIRECLNGDSASFGLLVDKYKEGIYALAYSRLRNFHDAEDITQDVFLKAYRNLRTLRRWDSFLVWIRSIAINLCKNRIRAQSRRPDAESIEDQETRILDKVSADFYSDQQSSISRDEALDSISKALESLPEIYQQVLTLHYLGGMSGEQMSQFLGISHANVRQRLSRARRQLREETLAMMSSTYEQQRLPAGFTFRVVEAIKRIKIHPMPRATALPSGLSLTLGIIITVLSLNPHVNLSNPWDTSANFPLPVEAKVLKTGEIPVDILKISETSSLSNRQGDGNDGGPEHPDPQKAEFITAQGEGGTWLKKADMPTPRSGLRTCVVDRKIYAIGGFEGGWLGRVIPTVEMYDQATDTWTEKADMPTARARLSTSVVDGKIYAIGGYGSGGGATFPAVEVYDPETDRWIKKNDISFARGAHSASVVNGKIYVIGGWGGFNNLIWFQTVEEYDPRTDTWTKKADMPTGKSDFLTEVIDGKIYVFGGYNGGFLSGVEVYDTATDTWTRKPNMPSANAGYCTSLVNGEIYIIGGGRGWNSLASDVKVYNPWTENWVDKADMPTARVDLSASVVNGRIYVIGGVIDGGDNVPTVEEYTPEGWPFEPDRAVSPHGRLPKRWGEIKSH